MGKVRPATALTRGLIVVILGLLIVASVGVSIHHRRGPSSAARASATAQVPVTAPGGGIPLGNGTKVLSESVDLLSLAVPDGWRSIDVDVTKLPVALRDLAQQSPAFSAVLGADAREGAEGGIRLFAYTPAPNFAFLSIGSFASPGAAPADETAVSAFNAQVKRYKAATVSVHTVQLPAGHAVQIESSLAVGKQHIVAQYDVFVTTARTVWVQLAAQTTTAALPPYFAQMLTSLRLG